METEIGSTTERGQAWVTAERLDEGSWDNCGAITDRKVRRMLGEVMTEWSDAVAFTCDDEGLSILVELRVTDDSNNETICWTNIVPVDKTQPECRDIGTVYYSCDELPSGDDLGGDSEVWNRFFDDSITLENVSIEELCGSNIEVFDTESSIDQCGYGWVNRYYKVYRQIDDKEFADSCRMSLVFSENHSYSITFPADEVKECEDLDQDDVIYSESGCDLITISRVEEKFEASADECYKIFRTFNIINWCEFEEEGSPIQLERLDMDEDGKDGDSYTIHFEYQEKTQHIFWDYQDEETNGDDQNRSDRRDTIGKEGLVSPDSKVVYWLSGDTQKDSIDFSDYTTSSWDLYWTKASGDHSEGYFTYTQILKVYDAEEPTIVFIAEQDSFPSYSNEQGCPGDVEIVATLGDDCTSDINQVEVTEAYLDAGNDAGANSDKFEYNVLADIEQADGAVTYKGSDLPAGTHRLRLVARDGCGNVRIEDHVFTVYDAKGSAPLCIEGFAVELMPLEDGQLGIAEVAAKDFLVNSPIADCSGDSRTYYITRLLNEEGDQKTADEIKLANTTSMILSCSDKGTLSVAVIATDQSPEKNKDYCITTISVQDNLTPCPEVSELTGIITTEDNETVSGVYLQVNGSHLRYERITQADGSFSIGGLEIGSDYTIAPAKNEDLLNGISTFDLVLISKHILGTALLDSPYKLIAADVNNSGSISTLDLIILRQNLLLQRSDFAGNTSWRFVPTAFSFPDPQNPWSASFPEVINVNDLQGKVQVDFVAIKVGDVNNSALNDIQQRSNHSLVLGIPNLQVDEGNEYEIEVKRNVSNITGFQTGVKFRDIEIIMIEEALVGEENFNYLESENTLLISWMKKAQFYAEDSDVMDLVRFKFKAMKNGRLSEMISIDQKNLSAEAYNPSGIIESVNIEFADTELAVDATQLMQNLPNPFKQSTIVDFYLREANTATLTITDVTGRVIKTISGNYQKGNHRVEITKEDLSAAGVYYYTLTTGNFVSTRKMVLIE